MRIVCPACESEYDVPDSVAGTGRKVRCARCQTVWLAAEGATAAAQPADAPPPAAYPAAPPAADATPPTAAPPEDATPDGVDTAPLVADPPLGGQARASRRPPASALAALEAEYEDDARRGLAPWMAAWVLSLAVVGAAAWASYHWRAEVMRVWPASERLYAMLGSSAEHAPQLAAEPHATNPDGPHGRE